MGFIVCFIIYVLFLYFSYVLYFRNLVIHYVDIWVLWWFNCCHWNLFCHSHFYLSIWLRLLISDKIRLLFDIKTCKLFISVIKFSFNCIRCYVFDIFDIFVDFRLKDKVYTYFVLKFWGRLGFGCYPCYH